MDDYCISCDNTRNEFLYDSFNFPQCTECKGGKMV